MENEQPLNQESPNSQLSTSTQSYSITSNSQGFTVIEALVIVLVIVIVGLVGWYIASPKNGAQLHNQVKKQAETAAVYTKSLAEHIGIGSNAIANKGDDQGCTIEIETKITFNPFQSHGADCTYYYYVYYQTSNPQKDIAALDKRIKAAGWDSADKGADTVGGVAYYEANPTEATSQPIDTYHFPGTPTSVDYPELNLDLITSSSPSAWPYDDSNNSFYAALTNKYLTSGKDIYGYEINEQYAAPSCIFCSAP
jgi:Tfp pilus assembly protein PilV